MNIQEMIDGYLECALWASTDEHGAPLDDAYCVADIDPASAIAAGAECADFYSSNECDLDAYLARGYSAAQAGHDFWLTRCGHGAGFWDRGLGALGARLTDASKVYGNRDIYTGDDGRLHFS